MRTMEYLQLDPLQIIARSQDITLYSRVLDYRPGMWEDVTYKQRKFFDWGGWLAVRPMDELPHWRVVMHREHVDAIAEMQIILRERGVVSNRDFEMTTRTRTQSYRGRKDSALALYYLWRTGEVNPSAINSRPTLGEIPLLHPLRTNESKAISCVTILKPFIFPSYHPSVSSSNL